MDDRFLQSFQVATSMFIQIENMPYMDCACVDASVIQDAYEQLAFVEQTLVHQMDTQTIVFLGENVGNFAFLLSKMDEDGRGYVLRKLAFVLVSKISLLVGTMRVTGDKLTKGEEFELDYLERALESMADGLGFELPEAQYDYNGDWVNGIPPSRSYERDWTGVVERFEAMIGT